MTDKERLLTLLADFGITPVHRPQNGDEDGRIYLSAYDGGVEGYPGFYCAFDFDDAGKFKEVGVWE